MSVTQKQAAALGQKSTVKQLTALRVSQAAAGVEAALGTLGEALREDAQVRVLETLDRVKRGLVDGEGRIGGLLARVPAVGPWLVMELFRATHAEANEDELPVRPTNREEPMSSGDSMLAYLECIGCHVA